MGFQLFNFDSSLQDGLDAMGFDKPTPIQEAAIPVIQEGKDLIACAQTGTGKTAAFILPVIDKIVKSGKSSLNTLVLAPTRELAIQIDQQIQGFTYFAGVSSISIYGGGDGIAWEQQKKAMEMGAEIVVATPGRLIALLQGKKIDLSTLEHLILDEADRMMDMGFSDDILTIINYLPKERQTILFSATMPAKIRSFSKQILQNPEEISLALGKTAAGVTQKVYAVYDGQKEALIRSILTSKDYEAVIIFASTKEKVKSLHKLLRKDFEVEAFHSDLEQAERESIMSRFKNRQLKILIGTDIISRGIDVVGIELVVNFDTPNDPEDYVHRVGRTARADSKGEAITFVSDKDAYKYFRIEQLIGMEIEKCVLPEGFEPGPELRAKGKSSSGPNKGGKKPFKKKDNRQNGQRPKQSHPEATSKPEASKPVERHASPKPQTSPKQQETKSAGASKFRQRKNIDS